MRWLRIFLIALLALALLPAGGQYGGAPAGAAEEQAVDFAGWLEALRAEALGQGISAATLDAALAGDEEKVPGAAGLGERTLRGGSPAGLNGFGLCQFDSLKKTAS